jgi:hypothetical protein
MPYSCHLPRLFEFCSIIHEPTVDLMPDENKGYGKNEGLYALPLPDRLIGKHQGKKPDNGNDYGIAVFNQKLHELVGNPYEESERGEDKENAAVDLMQAGYIVDEVS